MFNSVSPRLIFCDIHICMYCTLEHASVEISGLFFFFLTEYKYLKKFVMPFYHYCCELSLCFESLMKLPTPFAMLCCFQKKSKRKKEEKTADKPQTNQNPNQPTTSLNILTPSLILRDRRPKAVLAIRFRQSLQAIDAVLELVPGFLPKVFPVSF
jgi:hypothetical protein